MFIFLYLQSLLVSFVGNNHGCYWGRIERGNNGNDDIEERKVNQKPLRTRGWPSIKY